MALGLTAVVNLALTLFLGPGARPVTFHEDGSLSYLVQTEQPTVNRRYGFYLELDDATDPGTLVVPAGSFVDVELADGLADIDVVVSDYEPFLPDGVEVPDPLGIVETDLGDIPYSIIEGGDDLWWLAYQGDGEVVVIPDTVSPVPTP